MIGSPLIDVLVVGAGPTGLATACLLLRQGLRVRIVDKRAGPSTTSKAIGLQYRVSEVLACMGIVDRFLARGGTPSTVNMYSGERRLVQLKFRDFGHAAGRDAFVPAAILIPQNETEELLGQLLAERGGRIEWNTELVEFSQDDQRVAARLRSADGREETVEASWLVSCEGAHSVARKQAGIEFTGKTYPLAFFMADVELDWNRDHGENHVWFHRDGSFAALPLPKPRTWRMFVEVAPTGDAPREVTLDMIRQLMVERIGDTETKITNPTWISEFRIHCRMVDRYRSGRVLLAGDAAHIHSPTGGQGIATGIQDATNLAWKLGRVVRGAPERLLDTYQEERLPKAREVLRETDRTTTIMFAPTKAMRLLRDLVVLPLLRMDAVQKKMFAKLAQLHVTYRGSRLSQHDDRGGWMARTRLRAGDRAPDVAFERAASRERTTLFQLLEAVRPVALVGAGSTTDAARLDSLFEEFQRRDVDAYLVTAPSQNDVRMEARRLIDVHGDFRRMYGMSGEFVCIIRPDDHVGLFLRTIDEACLRSYLDEMCGPRADAPTHVMNAAASAG